MDNLAMILSLAKKYAIKSQVTVYIKKFSCGTIDMTINPQNNNKEITLYEINSTGKKRKYIS